MRKMTTKDFYLYKSAILAANDTDDREALRQIQKQLIAEYILKRIIVIGLCCLLILSVFGCAANHVNTKETTPIRTTPAPTIDPNKEKEEFMEKAKKEIQSVILDECKKDDKKVYRVGSIQFSNVMYDGETYSGALLYGTVLCIDLYGQPVHTYTFSANYSATDSSESWAFVQRSNSSSVIFY